MYMYVNRRWHILSVESQKDAINIQRCSKMFHREPEGRYCCTKYMAIAPFWFSMEHLWILIAPFCLSTDDLSNSVLHLSTREIMCTNMSATLIFESTSRMKTANDRSFLSFNYCCLQDSLYKHHWYFTLISHLNPYMYDAPNVFLADVVLI